jgi:hypothetical protein
MIEDFPDTMLDDLLKHGAARGWSASTLIVLLRPALTARAALHKHEAKKLAQATELDKRLKEYHCVCVGIYKNKVCVNDTVATVLGLQSVESVVRDTVRWAFADPQPLLYSWRIDRHMRGMRVAMSSDGVASVRWEGRLGAEVEIHVHEDKERAYRHRDQIREESGDTFSPGFREKVVGLVRKT